MNAALTIYGLSFLLSPVSTIYRTWEAGSLVYHIVKFTTKGVIYLVTPSPPLIEEGWDDLPELDTLKPCLSLACGPCDEHDLDPIKQKKADT